MTVKMVLKLSADGDKKYIAAELQETFDDRGSALQAFEEVRGVYSQEVAPSVAERLCQNMTVDMMVAAMTEDIARGAPFPLAKVKGESYVGKTVGEVWDSEPGLVAWVCSNIGFESTGNVTERVGIAACFYMKDTGGEGND